MLKIIQFLHTSLEATPVNDGDTIIPWNNHENHRRKFILSRGKYVNNENLEEESELTFWGEWEAQSEITKIKKSNSNPPNYLNRPFIDPSVPIRTHNTDPYVFGNNFRYIICKQGFFHNVLTNLDANSIILFGSSIDGQFCLDTVFVVSEKKENYNKNNIEEIFSEKNQYYHASVNPIYDEFDYNRKAVGKEDFCRIKDNQEYKFYTGVNFNQKKEYKDMYSFVPCKIFDQKKYIFRQPPINLDFINPGQTQGINPKTCTIKEIIHYWNEISEQIREAGLQKGTYFKTPELKTE